eukprot:COSAG02_NODE_10463_length_1936_cov_101.572482_1_plen_60_part_00
MKKCMDLPVDASGKQGGSRARAGPRGYELSDCVATRDLGLDQHVATMKTQHDSYSLYYA